MKLRLCGLLAIGMLMLAGSAHAYNVIHSERGPELHWLGSDLPIHWVLDKNGAPGNAFPAVEAAILASFNTWQNVECTSLRFEYNGVVTANPKKAGSSDPDKVNTVLWINQDEWPQDWTDAFAVTVPLYELDSGRIVDADILCNKNFGWSTNALGEANKADIQSILTHEIGHFFGLDHCNSTLADATMYWASIEGEIYKRSLAADDIQGVCHQHLVEGMNGSPCLSDTACKDGRVCVSHAASGSKICSSSCECDSDCSPAFVCLNGRCLPPRQELGEIGYACSSTKPCGYRNAVCVEGLCSYACGVVRDCPDEWSCEPVVGGGHVCWTSDTPIDPNQQKYPLSLALNPEGKVLIGNSVTLTATAEKEGTLLYRFSVREAGGAWEVLKEFSQNHSAPWLPNNPGSYEVQAEVKEEGSEVACADVYVRVGYTVTTEATIDGGDDVSYPKGDDSGCSSVSSGFSWLLPLLSALAFGRRKD